jgi:hypothetical protein
MRGVFFVADVPKEIFHSAIVPAAFADLPHSDSATVAFHCEGTRSTP